MVCEQHQKKKLQAINYAHDSIKRMDLVSMCRVYFSVNILQYPDFCIVLSKTPNKFKSKGNITLQLILMAKIQFINAAKYSCTFKNNFSYFFSKSPACKCYSDLWGLFNSIIYVLLQQKALEKMVQMFSSEILFCFLYLITFFNLHVIISVLLN